MNTAVIHVHRGGPLVALLGNPNCGKTALFNRLTGSRQKVANYAGVTVERKEGAFTSTSGRRLRLLDLPGTYSLVPRSPDERVTRDVLTGQAPGEKRPDLLLCVVDAGHLQRHLRLVLAARRLGLPMVVALNMSDLASRRGLHIDSAALQRELGVPVLPTVAVSGQGCDALRHCLDDPASWQVPAAAGPLDHAAADAGRVRQILAQAGVATDTSTDAADRADRLLLHPLAGPLLLAVLLFLVFQAVFTWAEAPMGWIESATAAAGHWLLQALPDHRLRSLLVDGLVAGVGGVLVFLPQILILFFFILVLEESGYLPRAAFLLDRLLGGLGLSGRSFIPLLSSFACAIPGIMATRGIADPRERRVTIAIAPLMTCSARLPVYALLIGAFVPARDLAGGIGLQGLVLFVLYVAGIAAAALLAWAAQRLGGGSRVRTLMMELPDYHWPRPRDIAIGLWQRALIFLRRVGTLILALTLLMWLLASWPAAPEGASGAPIEHGLAGMTGRALAVVFEPVGFNWQISVALVPGLAAREVAVGALGTVYALSATGDDAAAQLLPLIAAQWSLPTALALLAWYVFAPQCLATLATMRRETGSWRMVAGVTLGLFALAWVAAFVTYRLAVLWTA